MNLQIGDSVIVKDGVKESDEHDFVVGGWQGRIKQIVDDTDIDNPLLEIEWDSITLQQMPDVFVRDSYFEKVPWQTMRLRQSLLAKTEPRDEEGDVSRVQNEGKIKFFMELAGESGPRIAEILTDNCIFDPHEAAQRWLSYFKNNVRLPLPVVVEDPDYRKIFKSGAIARIASFDVADSDQGIWLTLVYNTKKLDFQLYNLKTLSADSPYAQLLEDYKVWFDALDIFWQ